MPQGDAEGRHESIPGAHRISFQARDARGVNLEAPGVETRTPFSSGDGDQARRKLTQKPRDGIALGELTDPALLRFVDLDHIRVVERLADRIRIGEGGAQVEIEDAQRSTSCGAAERSGGTILMHLLQNRTEPGPHEGRPLRQSAEAENVRRENGILDCLCGVDLVPGNPFFDEELRFSSFECDSNSARLSLRIDADAVSGDACILHPLEGCPSQLVVSDSADQPTFHP